MQAMQEAGAIAVVLPAHGFADDADALLDRLDGLLFSGGPDLDPATYGAAPHPQLGPNVDRAADEYELALLAAATARDLPLLAICRGMQALNVARGGTLHQHLPDRTQLEHRQTARALRARARRHCHRQLAAAPAHRPPPARRSTASTTRPIDALGKRLQVCAHAPDGTVEAIFDPGRALLPRRPVARRAAHAPVRARAAVQRAGGRGERRGLRVSPLAA